MSASDVQESRDKSLAPKGDIYHGSIAEGYHQSRSKSPKWEQERQSLLSLLDECPDIHRVLDVPFGTGRFVQDYRTRGLEVVGLDSSLDMFNASRVYLREHSIAQDETTFVVGDAFALPFADEQFDAVVCVRFLASVVALKDVPMVLAEIARVSARFALIQFRVPAASVELPATRRPEERMEHQCGVDDQDLLLDRAGFRILSETFDGDPERGGLRLVLCRRPLDAHPEGERFGFSSLMTLPETWISDTFDTTAVGE